MEDRWTGLEAGEHPFRVAAPFYADYRYRPSREFVRLLASHLGWTRDDRLLDLGAGPAHVSVLVAPYVGEVVVVEPEQAMLDEGRRRAGNVDNLRFVLGGSDDLPRLRSSLGEFAAVVISQAFHWMRDQDSVLRSLDEMVDRRRGAVALIGYVNEPDYNRAWLGLDRAPWSAAASGGCPEGAEPRRASRSLSGDSRAILVSESRAAVMGTRGGGSAVDRRGPRPPLLTKQHTRPAR